MTHIQLDYGKTLEFFGEHELEQQKDIVKTLHKTRFCCKVKNHVIFILKNEK